MSISPRYLLAIVMLMTSLLTLAHEPGLDNQGVPFSGKMLTPYGVDYQDPTNIFHPIIPDSFNSPKSHGPLDQQGRDNWLRMIELIDRHIRSMSPQKKTMPNDR